MTRVVFVGEMYNADLQVGGGPMPGGGGPVDPGYSPPWARPQPPVIAGGPGWLPRPPGPVDPGYSPPWARPPVDPGWVGGVAPPNVIGGGPIYPGGPVDPGYSPPWAQAPVDPGYSPPWARPQPPHISGGPGSLPPFAMPPIYIPPQAPPIDPVNPNLMHVVAYIPNADGTKVERITFTVEKPEPTTPTEPEPKA